MIIALVLIARAAGERRLVRIEKLMHPRGVDALACRDMDPPPDNRATCYRCRKPSRLCLCARVSRVANRTPVLVLQHRRERFHAVGTTRIARLGLAAAEVLEGVGVVPEPALRHGAALLYPGPQARELAELTASEHPTQLVVLDGTWHQARRLFLDNPWLQRLPQVRLTPSEPSRYRIRKQPAEHCVSTLESVVGALRLLEPETLGLDGLIDAFDTMVDEQLTFMADAGRDPRFQRRCPRKSRALPQVLRDSPERVVVVYGETAPGARVNGETSRQLVRWSALRVATGEVFDRVVKPEGRPPPEGHLAHMGLGPADLDAADDLGTVGRAWSAYRQPRDVLAAWHPAMLRMHTWLEVEPTQHAEGLALRSLWSNVTQTRPGGLQQLFDRLDLELPVLPLAGRAAERLGFTAAIFTHLLSIAPELARVTARRPTHA